MVCKLCNDTGDQRYWEGRWRDDQKVIAALREALRYVLEDEPNLMPRATSSCRDHIRHILAVNEQEVGK